MTKALATTNGAAPATIGGFNREAIDTIKATVAKGATDAELEMFLHLANRYGLDPFAKEIWCTKYLKEGQNPATVPATIIVSRDGYLKAAQMDGDFDGIASGVVKAGDDFAFDPAAGSVKHRFGVQRGEILGAWAVVHHKRRRPVACFAEFSEYRGRSPIWQNYPSAMIQKVAEVQALKRQFGLSGLVSKEEIDHQVDDAPDVQRPAPSVQQIAAPAPDVLEGEIVEPTEEELAKARWDRANKRLRAIASKAGKAAGLGGDDIAHGIKRLLEGRSAKDVPSDELESLARMIEDDPAALTAALDTAQVFDQVVTQDGRSIHRETGEVLAAPADDDAHGNKDQDAFAASNAALMDALKAAFPGQPQPEITGYARNIAMGRFGATFDQITTAGRNFLAAEITAKRFDTIKLAQAQEVTA